jgi:zinc protease
LRDANDVIVAAARGLVMHDGGMKLGCLGRRFVAFAGVLAMASGCGRPLRPSIRIPSSIRLGGVPLRVSFAYRTFTMKNGMVVVLAPDQESNLVTVDMRYYVGASDEVAGKTGLAHLAEHLTFEVVPAEPPRADGKPPRNDTLTERISEAALSYNAYTNVDSTHYYSVGLTPSLEDLMQAEALRMTSACSQLSDALFERERAVVLQELAQSAERDAFGKALTAMVWGADHPFTHGVGGDDVATLTRDDYCKFVAKYYVPANATLIIGGKIDLDHTLQLIAKHFTGLPTGEAPAPVALPELPRGAVRRGQLPIDHPIAMVVYPIAPAGTERRTIQQLALQLAMISLRKKANDDDSVLGVGATMMGSDRQGAVALMLSSKKPQPEKLVKTILEAIDQSLETKGDLYIQQLKAMAVTNVAERHDDMLERGTLLGDHNQFAGDDDYGKEIAAIKDLDPEAIARAGRALFSRDEARYFYIDKSPDTKVTYELANVGEKGRFDLPPRTQGAAAAASLPFRQLAPGYQPVEMTLLNGLRVVLVPRRDDAFFEARFVFPSGDADDPLGLPGAAELAALLLEEPSENLRLGDLIARQMAAASGSSLAAGTTEHQTQFIVSGVPSQASLHLWRLHALLESGDYPADSLETLRKAKRWREEAERADAEDPEEQKAKRLTLLRRAVLRRLFGAGHPALSEGEDSLDKITLEDLDAFRNRHYRIDGATLVVVGGFDPAAVERDIYEMWGTWPKLAPPPSASSALPARPELKETYLALDRPDTQVTLVQTFVARSKPVEDLGVRLVAAELLNDRLAEIRRRQAATYGLSLSYIDQEGASFILITGRVAPDRGVEVLAAMREAWSLERANAGQLALEVARARRRALQQALAQSSSSTSIARQLVTSGGKVIEEQQRKAAAIAAVTTDQVRALVKADFSSERMVVAASGPGASDMLRAAGAAKVEIIP